MTVRFGFGVLSCALTTACNGDKGDDSSSAMDDSGGMDDSGSMMTHDPDTADAASIDRFSAEAGTLQVRTDSNGLPAANAPVDFDVAPFVTTGLGPDGNVVVYYNFDVQPTTPAPIYVLVRSDGTPVEDQLNIIGVIPGDDAYNDFWQVNLVTVPDDYRTNAIADVEGLMSEGYAIEETPTLVNCPVVPDGSTATMRAPTDPTPPDLIRGWYDNKVVYYFTFGERSLEVDSSGMVPTSDIYVTFNINPDQPDGGPASGFVTEPGTDQTHNVTETTPAHEGYSPLWSVQVYDNLAFDMVEDLATAEAATIVASDVADVNCPIVSFTSM